MTCYCYSELSFCMLDNDPLTCRDFYVLGGEI